ncbi:MAG: HTTM domain-containing protein [Cytophagales bacterium]|nr:HTTM domain-containing protein [Cytophagales bacterium]
MKNILFEEVDNSSLALYRMMFGFLLSAEGFGAIMTGWVRRVFVEPQYNFTAIGLEWMQTPSGYFMYGVYALLGILGICIMLGYHYRLSSILYFIIWTCVYLMQKSSYNNHYYLMVLLTGILIILPAHRYASLDAKRDPNIASDTCPRWITLFFILQLWIVYTYASLHKVYPDWLAGRTIGLWFDYKAEVMPELAFMKGLLTNSDFQLVISYLGIAYDGLIIPLLLWKRTRWIGILASFGFHLFNSLVFQIGVFPYMSLIFLVFFFPVEVVQKRFFKKKVIEKSIPTSAQKQNLIIGFLAIYFILQIGLPLRHHLFEGNVFWTEEGHKLSWRMMLRSKHGHANFYVINPETKKKKHIKLKKHFSEKQIRGIIKNPDMAWQAAQFLAKYYTEKHGFKEPEIRARIRVSLNGGPYRVLIDDDIDLAHTSWKLFSHNEWIHYYGFGEDLKY